MAKSKKKAKSNRPAEYNDKLAVKGNFLQIMQAAAKDANSKSAKKEDKK